MMVDLIAWTLLGLMTLAYFLDLSTDSRHRTALDECSQLREIDRIVDYCEWADLNWTEGQDLTAVQLIKVNEAARRLGYALTPDFIARMLAVKHGIPQ